MAKNRHGSGDLPREMYHFKTGKIVRKSENMGEREKDSAQPKVKGTQMQYSYDIHSLTYDKNLIKF